MRSPCFTGLFLFSDRQSLRFWLRRLCYQIPSPILVRYASGEPVTYPVEIAPSILAANFASLGEDIRAVELGGATLLHVDVMDGHFVPNISIGVPVVASLRKATRLPLDVHLMIEHPEQFIGAFAEAGADMISVHQEATPHLDRALCLIREHGCQPGVVTSPRRRRCRCCLRF